MSTAIDPALLVGRTATCSCGKQMPSAQATSQPFFEYRGPGTADNLCRHCKMHFIAHQYEAARVHPEPAPATRGHTFEALLEGYPTDSFYCGQNPPHAAGLD